MRFKMIDYSKYRNILIKDIPVQDFNDELQKICLEIEQQYNKELTDNVLKNISFLKQEYKRLYQEFQTFREREDNFERYLEQRFDIWERSLINIARKIKDENNDS